MTGTSCDLLSFYYLCRTRNNYAPLQARWNPVVICFHFTIFVVLGTTFLWLCHPWSCCDLLSFYYLCRTRNNRRAAWVSYQEVVICFHFTIFVVLGTTKPRCLSPPSRCDLLSFYYLCRTRNNPHVVKASFPLVVICFHFTIFVVLGTTPVVFAPADVALWFAFILLSLSY